MCMCMEDVVVVFFFTFMYIYSVHTQTRSLLTEKPSTLGKDRHLSGESGLPLSGCTLSPLSSVTMLVCTESKS